MNIRFWSHFVVLLKSDIDVKHPPSEVVFLKKSKSDLCSTTKCDQNHISFTIINLVTPKAGAKHELLFNKPALGVQETPL